MPMTEDHLAQRPQLSPNDLDRRKNLLGLTPEDETLLAAFQPTIAASVDRIVDTFYEQQTAVPEINALIAEPGTLAHLHEAMRRYVLDLFSGAYGPPYVNGRLRIGEAHARIGVSPWLFVASMHMLEEIVAAQIRRSGSHRALCKALHKLFLFDLQIVFGTYVDGLMAQVRSANSRLRSYAETLKAEVAERTAEIARAAYTDPLTGLGNRRAFFETLETEIETARSEWRPLSLAFFDVDGLKQINDVFGHLHGDQLLARIGTAMSDTFDETGTAFRYGGDEFCVVLPGRCMQEAQKLCAAFCRDITPSLTLSVGTAEFDHGETDGIDALIARADAAMYASRRRRDEPVKRPA